MALALGDINTQPVKVAHQFFYVAKAVVKTRQNLDLCTQTLCPCICKMRLYLFDARREDVVFSTVSTRQFPVQTRYQFFRVLDMPLLQDIPKVIQITRLPPGPVCNSQCFFYYDFVKGVNLKWRAVFR